MTDYLERLFAVRRDEAQERQEEVVRTVLQSEQPEWVGTARVQGEPVTEMILPGMETEEVIFGQRPRVTAQQVQEGGRVSVSLRRPEGKREGEALERRLRRDSRRYDSGFYRY